MKKIYLFIICLLLLTSLFGCANDSLDKDETNIHKEDISIQKKFDELLDKQFVHDLENDLYGCYALVERPSDYNIDTTKSKVQLMDSARIDISTEDFIEDNKYLYEALSLDYEVLGERRQDYYDSLKFILDINETLTDDKFDYYEQYFTTNNNVANTLAQALFDFNIRDEASVLFLIELFKSIDEYVDAILEYANKQLDMGYLMMDAEFVLNYTNNLISKDKSEMLKGIFETMDELALDEAYKDELLELANTSFNDNCIKIKEFIEKAKSSGKINNDGYPSLEYGNEYIALLLKNYSGSDISVDEYVEYVSNKFEDCFTSISIALSKDQKLTERFINTNGEVTLDFKSYDEILEFANDNMQNDFPDVGELEYVIEDINQAIIGEGNVMAYYWTAPIDNTKSEQMRVNPKYANLSSLSTYTTVTHEGLPGHMYQRNYILKNCESNYIKALGDMNKSMQEGYANYVGFYAMKYLDDPMCELYYLNEMVFNYLLLLSDIGINYYGNNEENIVEVFKEFGLDEVSAKEIYNMLKQDPLIFVPYYYGLAKIEDYKVQAQKELGDIYSDYDFHKALLDSYNLSFEVVSRNINKYINSMK